DILIYKEKFRNRDKSNRLTKYKLLADSRMFREGYVEGKRIKSYFLYVEFYDQFINFPEPFLRSIKLKTGESSFTLIHYTDDKESPLPKIPDLQINRERKYFVKKNSIKSIDDRIKTKQDKLEIINFFEPKLSEWYSDEDIQYFFKANFTCFEVKETPKLLISKVNKTWGIKKKLCSLTYDFYRMNYEFEKKERFALMLQENFKLLSKWSISTIKSAIR
ncbi:hypothetical protein ACFLSY_11190, partial [Bacteroidota bacterium]